MPRSAYFRAAAMSSSGVVTGPMLNFSTRSRNVAGDTNAGSDGPSLIFFTPSESKVSSTATAFCSYHDRMIVSGRSLI